MRILKALPILIILAQTIFAQNPAEVSGDTLSAAAKSDSAAAAYKIEALRQALGGDSYQPPPPITDNFQPPDFGKVATRMALGLGVILVLLYVLFLLLKKVRNVESVSNNSGQSIVKLLDSKFLGSGKSVLLIRVGAQRVLVVGSYTDGMRTLSEIEGDEARYILELYESRPVNAAQFSATVDHLLRRFKREGG
ncbi:MAG: flagellar biosynthetic protein FliO [Fibromonadaceae bacterium]|jgi:flagellar biogenesis protein FliO|nr:flagellar biosynthetic protein FliO [Fibromonadaceae bacterium]